MRFVSTSSINTAMYTSSGGQDEQSLMRLSSDNITSKATKH